MKLDAAYSNTDHVATSAEYPDRWAKQAGDFRASSDIRVERRTYGAGARHWFDFFTPGQPAKGTVIFVHGGYWRRFDAGSFSHFAAGALQRGWAVAMPSYDLCPDVRIAEITQQIASAIETISWQTSGPLALAGHSAGGHLVARMGDAGMLVPETCARISHVLPISPVSDLRPLLETSMNADLKLDMAEATAESPALHPGLSWPAKVCVGAAELPAFVDQARWLAQAWNVELIQSPGCHHFDVIDELQNPDGALVRALTSD